MLRAVEKFSKNGIFIYSLRYASAAGENFGLTFFDDFSGANILLPYSQISTQSSDIRDACTSSLERRKRFWSISSFWQPPSAKKERETREAYGVSWTDDYKWLECWDDEVYNYLMEETLYTRKYLSKFLRGSEKIKKELEELKILETDIPEVWWPYEYWSETTDEDNQIFYRRKVDDEKQEKMMLIQTKTLGDDLNQTSIGGIKISPCQNLMAFLTEYTKGSESYVLYVKDLVKDLLFEDEVIFPKVSGVEWSRDSKKLLYTTHDDKGRPSKVWVHVLGTNIESDVCLLHEEDEKFYVHIGATKDRKYILITTASKTSSEVKYIEGNLDFPYDIKLISPRQSNLEYFIEHSGNNFLILTNDTESGNYAIFTAGEESSDRNEWKSLLKDNTEFFIEDFEVFDQKCILLVQQSGCLRLKLLSFMKQEADDTEKKSIGDRYTLTDLPIPAWCRNIKFGTNLDYDSKKFRFFASSPIHPVHAFDYDFDTNQCHTVHIDSVNLKMNTEDFNMETLEAQGFDGTKIPITIVHKKDLDKNSQNPCLLDVYGAYGHCVDLSFQSHRLPLLSRGWVVAFAHVRGGGELGRSWHKMGRLQKKRNSVLDCAAVMRYLINQGYTSEGQIALESFSAGGIVAGSIINEHPDLLLAAILQVPFLDISTALSNPSLPLTQHEYDEWGDPNKPGVFKEIMNLCPYQNIKSGNFPPVFVNCSFNDSRVPVWGPAKWVSKLKENQRGTSKILLYTDFEGGHFSSEKERKLVRNLQYTFLERVWQDFKLKMNKASNLL